MPISVYYGKLNALWEELFHHVPLIPSTCCSQCTADSVYQARREIEKLHDFLMGLNSEYYARLRTQILSTDPLLTLDRASQLVSQDESVHLAKPEISQPTNAFGFVARTDQPRGSGPSDRPTCTFCHKLGHDTAVCRSKPLCSNCN